MMMWKNNMCQQNNVGKKNKNNCCCFPNHFFRTEYFGKENKKIMF